MKPGETPSNNALKLTAHGAGGIRWGAPQLRAVLDRPTDRTR
jgi:hypothetical protein